MSVFETLKEKARDLILGVAPQPLNLDLNESLQPEEFVPVTNQPVKLHDYNIEANSSIELARARFDAIRFTYKDAQAIINTIGESSWNAERRGFNSPNTQKFWEEVFQRDGIEIIKGLCNIKEVREADMMKDYVRGITVTPMDTEQTLTTDLYRYGKAMIFDFDSRIKDSLAIRTQPI